MMAGSIFQHIGGNKNKDELRLIERDYGGDLKNKEMDDDYYLELGPDYSPTFNSWLVADERRELIKELTVDKEKIFMK